MSVRVKNLTKSYNSKTVLNIEELGLKKSNIYAVLGPNGSGKTTMLRILGGVESADSGEIYYDGIPELPKDFTAFLSQKPYLFDLSVLRNVTLGLKNSKDAEKTAIDALNRIGMNSFLHRKARSLSGGEGQKVAIARTLVLKKKIAFLDEPASAVDIASVRRVEEYIRFVNKRDGTTIVFTTHNPSQALRVAHEVIMLWDGKVVERGTPSKILKSPEREETRKFLENWRI